MARLGTKNSDNHIAYMHPTEFQTNYLLALLYMLQKVPSQAIINELPKVRT